jgi:hypothetical protein
VICFAPSLAGSFFISNANPACSCVYICKFQFRPIHSPSRRLSETLRAFISRFTKVRGTIPRISDASIITAFRQGVRDEKMLEKLATHDVETVSTLFALADKCARAAEGRAWHSAPQTRVAQTGGSGAAPRVGKKKNKGCGHEKPRSTALVIAATTGGRRDHNKRPQPQRGNSGSCPVHPNSRHSTAECHEIIDLAKCVSERREQSPRDGSPPRRRPGKERVDDGEVAAAERDLGYQSPEGVLKDVITGDSNSALPSLRATEGTPHSPVYEAEACLPPETLLDSPRVQPSNGSIQKRLQHEDVDSISKRRWEPRVGT